MATTYSKKNGCLMVSKTVSQSEEKRYTIPQINKKIAFWKNLKAEAVKLELTAQEV